jgi:hypothetical protein
MMGKAGGFSTVAKIAMVKQKGLPCVLEDIVPSPILTGYRNKCEFSIGFDSEMNVRAAKTFAFGPPNGYRLHANL